MFPRRHYMAHPERFSVSGAGGLHGNPLVAGFRIQMAILTTVNLLPSELKASVACFKKLVFCRLI